MIAQDIDHSLDHLAAHPGIEAFGLVDPHTGLVWFERGSSMGRESTWEAAIDYWRLHDRQREHFVSLGELGALVAYHRHNMLAVVPCCSDPLLVIVALGQHKGVNWIEWQRLSRLLGERIAHVRKPATAP